MITKIKAILEDRLEDLERYEHEIKTLEKRLDFYSIHKFDEELRITKVHYDALNMAVYRWRKMYDDIMDALNSKQE